MLVKMPVIATRLIRKMRGGAQAFLLEASDHCCYVTKFADNPQHRRILVNEWLATSFLSYLGIHTPTPIIVEVNEEFLRASPEVAFTLGSRTIPVAPGLAYGSRFPKHPDQLAVYDYLPDALLTKVVNLREFLGVLVFDKWVGNADARQAIFFRTRVREFLDLPDVAPQQKGFVAAMIDHGYSFNGPNWEFVDAPAQGLYFRHLVYESVRSLEDFEPWIDRITHFPDAEIDRAWRSFPRAWLQEDEGQLESMLEALIRRRARISDLLEDVRRNSRNPFPNWK